MSVFICVFIFLLGAVIASFVGLVCARLYTHTPIFGGRSKCDHCGAVLGAAVLVPIFSWVFSRGYARCCGSKLSAFSTGTEILLGGLFVLAYLAFGLSLATSVLCAALALLLAIVLYDFTHFIIPPIFLWPFVLASLIFALLVYADSFQYVLLGALLCAGFLALIHFASRGRAMGLADAPFSAGLALLAGPLALSGFVFSFWIGAVVGIIILARTPKGSRMGIEVPFAPYLATGFLLALFTSWNVLNLTTSFLASTVGA